MPRYAFTQSVSARVPSIPYGYSASQGKSTCGSMSASDQLSIKAQLAIRLNTCRLSNMPGGFPFHHIHDGHGSYQISYNPFEFREDFLTSSHPGRWPHCRSAVISFSPPSPRSKINTLTWCAYLPTSDNVYTRDFDNGVYKFTPVASRFSRLTSYSQDKISLAEVQVDPAVLKSPYGKTLMTDPMVILRALAISLELGAIITIEFQNVANLKLAYNDEDKVRRFEGRSVVYTSTKKDGRQKLLFVVNH